MHTLNVWAQLTKESLSIIKIKNIKFDNNFIPCYTFYYNNIWFYDIRLLRRINMDIIKYYGNDENKNEFIKYDAEPLMAVIAHDSSHAIVSLLDEGCEHHILLSKAVDKYNIDEYFRIIFDNTGADWTFVCPPNYKNIVNKEKRITQFFNDGVDIITEFLKEVGYDVPINIPKRYRRHIDYLNNSDY